MPQRKNKGLGRGLDALFTEFDETATADETVVELNLDDIRSNPYQPRKTFDETSLSELSDSIRKQGVFQPIIVRQSKVSGYEIIAGERRYRASKMAKRTTIPAIVRDLNEEEMMEIAVLENLQREDLTPLEEAQAYNTLMENLNLTQAQVSEKLGKSRPYIANYLRLLSLPKAVKDFLQKGLIFTFGPTCALNSAISSKVAPPLEKPVEVLMKSAPEFDTISHSLIFSSSVSRHVSMITFRIFPWHAALTALISSNSASHFLSLTQSMLMMESI